MVTAGTMRLAIVVVCSLLVGLLVGTMLSEPLQAQYLITDDDGIDPCEREALIEREEQWLEEQAEAEGIEVVDTVYDEYTVHDPYESVSAGLVETGGSWFSREDQLLIDVIVGRSVDGMAHIIEFGTGSGIGTLSLALHGHQHTMIDSFDINSLLMPLVTENANDMVTFRLLEADSIADGILSVMRTEGLFVKEPSIVVINPIWFTSLAEAGVAFSAADLLFECLEPLPSTSIIIMPTEVFEAVREGYDGPDDLFPFHIDSHFDLASVQMDCSLSGVRVSHDRALQEFDYSLLPDGVAKDAADLQPTALLEKNDWLVFLRFPKCGTKSFSNVLKVFTSRQSCSGDFLTSPPFENRACHIVTLCNVGINRMIEVQRHGKCPAIESHHCSWNDLVPPVDAFAEEESARSRKVTILRDPVHRVVSEFKHVHGAKRAWDYCPNTPTSGLSKEAFLAFYYHEDNAWGMSNRQTRMLAGCGTTEPCNLTDEELLDLAKRHLLECDMVGLTEDFSSSMLLLSYAFGWSIHSYAYVSEAKDKQELHFEIDDEVRDAVLSMNHLDAELHAFAKEVVQHRLVQLQQRLMIDGLPEYRCTEQASCIMFDPFGINWDALWKSAQVGGAA